MAEKDIKDLENVTALANTDELLAIVAGLGRNYNWAKMKEQLIKELPEATTQSRGLLSSDGARWSSGLSFYVAANSELDIGMGLAGLIFFSNYNITGTPSLGIIASNGAYINPIFQGTLMFNENAGGIDKSAARVFKRSNDGHIFIKNNTSAGSSFILKIVS